MAGRFRFVAVCGALIVAAAGIAAAGAEPSTGSAAAATAKFVDLSLLVSPEHAVARGRRLGFRRFT